MVSQRLRRGEGKTEKLGREVTSLSIFPIKVLMRICSHVHPHQDFAVMIVVALARSMLLYILMT